MQKSKYFRGFTLVELIIVITILIILGSIALVSFQGYSKNSRDSSRLSTISTIHKGISLNQATTGKAVLPDDFTQVFASGYLMGYEGIVGENIGRIVGLNNIPKDPKTGENYIYYTNPERNKGQVMGFLEGEEMTFLGINKANASGTGTKIPKVTGDNLGIILDQNYNRVTGSGIDILKDNSSTIYKVYFSNTDSVTSTGGELFSNIYNRRIDLLSNTNLVSFDENLIGYWDMETLTGGILKDLSQYGNHGTLNGGIIAGGVDGIKGKATYFDGVNDSLVISDNSNKFYFSDKGFTISYYVKVLDISKQQEILSKGVYPNNGFRTYFYPNQGLNIQIFGETKYDNIFYNINKDEWYNFTASYDKHTLKLYINGTLVKKQLLDIVVVENSNNLAIGRVTNWNGLYFNGTLDEVKVYNRALSETEIQNLYNSTK